MDSKNLGRVEIKDADKGQVVAVFSTFNTVDLDGDVVIPGAFEDGAKVRISAYNHMSWMGELPVGKGVVRTSDTEAILDGQFFMDTAHGLNTFNVIKAMGNLQEWSYGFDILKASFGQFDGREVRFLEQMKMYEVSPVLIGAGVDTRTLVAKNGDMTLIEQGEAVVTAVSLFADRAARVLALREGKGKGLGSASRELITRLEAEIKRLSGVLNEPAPGSGDEESDSNRLFLELVASKHRRGRQ